MGVKEAGGGFLILNISQSGAQDKGLHAGTLFGKFFQGRGVQVRERETEIGES